KRTKPQRMPSPRYAGRAGRGASHTEGTEAVRETFQVRREQPDDAPAIHRVVAAAFGRPLEAELVDALRANGRMTLELVAVLGGGVVGHVAFSPGWVEGPDGAWEADAVGPLAVAPPHQRQAIGPCPCPLRP